MGNVREEGINMYLTDNYTPKMNQIISVTDTFRRATVTVSLSTNVMASSIKNSIGSASSTVNSLNSSLRKIQTTVSSVSSTMTKLSSSINSASGAIGSLNGSIMRLAVTIAMIINYFNKLIQKKNEFNSNPIIILTFKVKNNELEKTKNKTLGSLKQISGKSWPVVIEAKDTAKGVVSNLLEKLKYFIKNRWQGIVNLKDMASSIISKVFPKLRLFAGKVWTGAIAVKDMASGILSSIKGKISDLTNGATIGIAVKKGVDLLGQEQNQKVVLESVMKRNTGNVSKKDVNTYYDSLVKMANDTPFDPEDVVAMGTKAKMISNITGGKKEKDITQAMVDVRALNMDTSSTQDVSAAFLSAAKGNMESLNTLVGENYKTFDEALEGISMKQMGLAKEMSETIPGIIAAAQTSINNGLKSIVKPFDDILGQGIGKIKTFIESGLSNLASISKRMAEKIGNVVNGRGITSNKDEQMQFRSMKNKKGLPDSAQFRLSSEVEKRKMMAENKQENFENSAARMIGNAPKAIVNTGNTLLQNIDFTALIDSLLPVVNLVNNLLDSINNKSPIAQGLISIFGTIVTTAFQLIGPVVEAVSPIITRIFTFLGEHAPQINYFIETMGNVWKTVWETLGPILEEAWKFLEPLLDSFLDALKNLSDFINLICDSWKKMVKSINESPITAKIGKYITERRKKYEKEGMDSGLAHDSGTNPDINALLGNAFGLNYVPYNDYPTRLHEGEMVLTKQEANQYRSGKSGGNISIAKLADTIVIREEADIEKVTSKLVSSIKMAQLGGVL
ncbi:hypothetical protein C4R89_14815 [Clostridioides difficile]|nr:hypothetical protein [Clostridioides difficile]MDB0440775.1 hypothetical protein [Clostridioides difficile]